jgi:hypothetical protein
LLALSSITVLDNPKAYSNNRRLDSGTASPLNCQIFFASSAPVQLLAFEYVSEVIADQLLGSPEQFSDPVQSQPE